MADSGAFTETTQERMYEAELHRLRGDLLLIQDAANAVEAEGCFRMAIEIAHWQSAKSLELRAALSLARLLPVKVNAGRVRCWPKSTTGSPKASTPPI